MSRCSSCTADCELYLCGRCCTELSELLASLLPHRDEGGRWREGLLDYLRDAAVGQAKLGDGGRRTRPSGLHGDEHADAMVIQESGHTASGGRWWIEQPKYTLNRVLAAGGVNARASDLRVEMFEAMRMWARHIAKTNQLDMTWRTTMGYTDFLHKHVGRVAQDQDAGELLHRVRGLVRRIERTINRPEPPRFCGPCPTIVGKRKQCATRLEAPPNAAVVTCPTCKQTHQVEQLMRKLLEYLKDKRGTSTELRELLQGSGHHLPKGTFDTWCHRKKLRPVGWLRPHGGRAIRRHSDQDSPLYLMSDLLELMGLATEEATA